MFTPSPPKPPRGDARGWNAAPGEMEQRLSGHLDQVMADHRTEPLTEEILAEMDAYLAAIPAAPLPKGKGL